MDNKVIDYCLIRADSSGISSKINTLLSKGWELYGTPFSTGDFLERRGYPGATHYDKVSIIAQAVVKRSKGSEGSGGSSG